MSDGKEVVEDHGRAIMMLYISAYDYLKCRCLYLNGFVDGFHLATTSLEKILKAYILIREPEADVKQHYHNLKKLFKLAFEDRGANLYPDFPEHLIRANRYFGLRYREGTSSKSLGPEDLESLDRLYIHFAMNFPLNGLQFYQTGLLGIIFHGSNTPEDNRHYKWLVTKNKYFTPGRIRREHLKYQNLLSDRYNQ